MRNILILLLIVGFAFVTGCASTNTSATPSMDDCLAKAPKWVMDPSLEGGLAAGGSAKLGATGMQFARTEALANGRDELARMTQVTVKNMTKNFMETTGLGDNQTVDRVSTQVSKQVAAEVLNGSRQKEMWPSPCNEIFMLVVIDPNVAKQTIKNAIATSMQNEQALYQKWQAEKAQDELKNEVENLNFMKYKNSQKP